MGQYDEYYGVEVRDPYRWMEKTDHDDTRAWVEAQRALADDYFREVPSYPWIASRVHERKHPDASLPVDANGATFRQVDQQILITTADGSSATLIPDGFLDAHGLVLARFYVAPDAGHVVALLSEGGAVKLQAHIIDTASKTLTDDAIANVVRVVWLSDSSSFLYSQQRPEGNTDLCLHRLGTRPSDDFIFFAESKTLWNSFLVGVTDDMRFLVFGVYLDSFSDHVYYCYDIQERIEGIVELFSTKDEWVHFLGGRANELLFQTSVGAPRGRIVAVDPRNPDPKHWREVVPESDLVIDHAAYMSERFLVTYLDDVRHTVKLLDLAGSPMFMPPLAGSGWYSGFEGTASTRVTYYSVQDVVTPPQTYRLDLLSLQSTPVTTAAPAVATDRFTTEQVFYENEGARIPMFIVHPEGRARDGRQRVWLHVYGSYGKSNLPAYSAAVTTWLEMGGTYAIANVRGGGEYGRDWHLAGRGPNKETAVLDLVRAAEWLIDEGYTSPRYLAIVGSKNGGMLVGAALVKRPELFGAVVAHAGVFDLLRHHVIRGYYGLYDAEIGTIVAESDFSAIKTYTPLQYVREETEYPAVLLQSRANDDRYLPAHSYKFAAMLQHAQAGDAPILMSELEGGGALGFVDETGNVRGLIEQVAFLSRTLGLDAPSDETAITSGEDRTEGS